MGTDEPPEKSGGAAGDAVDGAGQPDTAHCPHCGGVLPDPDGGGDANVSFCPHCGRRVEGWRTGMRARLGGANAAATVPGHEEPTRALAPSPTLLRAAIAAQQQQDDSKRASDAVPTVAAAQTTERIGPVGRRKKSSGWGLLGLIGGAVAFALGALVLLEGPRHPTDAVAHSTPAAAIPTIEAPAPQPDPTPSAKPAPVVTTTPDEPAPKPEAPVAKPAEAKPVPAPVKIVAATPAIGKPDSKAGKGGLPHRATGKTDSLAVGAAGQPSATGATGTAPPPLVGDTGEGDASPQQQLEPPFLAGSTIVSPASEARAENMADGVRFVVQAHLPQVQACYGHAFKDTAPGGRVDIGFVINATGRATKIRTEQNTTHSTALSSCIEQRIAEWQFARPPEGSFELIYPFVFSPGT